MKITNKIRNEFSRLSGVNNDPLSQKTVSQLVSAAQFEIDLHEEGEEIKTPIQLKKLKAFVNKYYEN